MATPPAPPQSSKEATSDYLKSENFPDGFITEYISNLKKITKKFMILDDSGSMNVSDGTMLQNNILVKCTRWKEMGACVKIHAQLADVSKASTEFRFLNAGVPIIVGEENDDDSVNLKKVETILNDSPGGLTPVSYNVLLYVYIYFIVTKINLIYIFFSYVNIFVKLQQKLEVWKKI